MGSLDNVDWACGGGDGDTETKQEAATHELINGGVDDGGSTDDCSKNNKEAADEHTDTAAPSVDGGSNEGKSADGANLVHGGNETSLSDVSIRIARPSITKS